MFYHSLTLYILIFPCLLSHSQPWTHSHPWAVVLLPILEQFFHFPFPRPRSSCTPHWVGWQFWRFTSCWVIASVFPFHTQSWNSHRSVSFYIWLNCMQVKQGLLTRILFAWAQITAQTEALWNQGWDPWSGLSWVLSWVRKSRSAERDNRGNPRLCWKPVKPS